ncbi:hypothetical protein BDZ45DRAFT_670510 [Acephala macrosclerotiorum]|nr:hypothetical protein BDZ45DRAFT_670510 [Acephala macrosclerotiorum]
MPWLLGIRHPALASKLSIRAFPPHVPIFSWHKLSCLSMLILALTQVLAIKHLLLDDSFADIIRPYRSAVLE